MRKKIGLFLWVLLCGALFADGQLQLKKLVTIEGKVNSVRGMLLSTEEKVYGIDGKELWGNKKIEKGQLRGLNDGFLVLNKWSGQEGAPPDSLITVIDVQTGKKKETFFPKASLYILSVYDKKLLGVNPLSEEKLQFLQLNVKSEDLSTELISTELKASLKHGEWFDKVFLSEGYLYCKLEYNDDWRKKRIFAVDLLARKEIWTTAVFERGVKIHGFYKGGIIFSPKKTLGSSQDIIIYNPKTKKKNVLNGDENVKLRKPIVAGKYLIYGEWPKTRFNPVKLSLFSLKEEMKIKTVKDLIPISAVSTPDHLFILGKRLVFKPKRKVEEKLLVFNTKTEELEYEVSLGYTAWKSVYYRKPFLHVHNGKVYHLVSWDKDEEKPRTDIQEIIFKAGE